MQRLYFLYRIEVLHFGVIMNYLTSIGTFNWTDYGMAESPGGQEQGSAQKPLADSGSVCSTL